MASAAPLNPNRFWLYCVAAAVIFFLILPIAVVVPVSFSDSKYLQFPPEAYSTRWYESYWNSSDWLRATRVSLTVAFCTVLLTVPLGTAAAYAMTSVSPRAARFLQIVLLLPMIVPGMLVAIGIFYIYIRFKLVNSLIGIVVAHTVLALPFAVMTVQAALQSFDFRQEQAAMSLGATRFGAFFRVTLPQIKAAVISSGLFVFIISLDEVVISLFIAGGENTVLTRRMFVALRDAVDPTVAAISTLLIGTTLLLLVALAVTRRGQRG
ncbi:MAG: ABC transporter permease [Rhizobiales bacterium]|nr:ABC transporter permease [Hyphomicrobiales bacterium]